MSTLTTQTKPREFRKMNRIDAIDPNETIATRVWIDEYAFLRAIYHSTDNCSPTFRMPDLISACVSLIFLESDPAARILTYLNTTLVLRNPDSERRQEKMWCAQYRLLLALQTSAMNAHPNPQYKLDQFTTACVALVMQDADAGRQIIEQARKNTAARAGSREAFMQ